MKSRLLIIVIVLLVGISPAAAQQNLPEASIPADFTGFVRFKVESEVALSELRIAEFAALVLQPGRFDPNTFAGYDSLFPVDMLDVEGVTFSQVIQPWLQDAIIVAYRQFGPGLRVSSDDALMILPTSDILRAASYLGPVIQLQDFPQRVAYRDVTIYVGDKTAIALAPEAVFIGPVELIKEALDVRAGEHERLIDQPAYETIRPKEQDKPLAFAYLGGEQGSSALSILLGGDSQSEPLLRALGETIRESHNEGTVEASLLTASLDAIGVSVYVDSLPLVPGLGFVVGPNDQQMRVRAEATFYAADRSAFSVSSEYDSTLLDMIPQTAMVVQTGANPRGAVYDLLASLPLATFAGRILRAFPVNASPDTTGTDNTAPSTQDLQRAVTGFLSTLNSIGDFNLDEDLLAHLTGSYVVALIPRPNNPTPALNTPFDLLLVVQVDDGDAALGGLTKLVELLTGIKQFEDETLGDFSFSTIRDADTGDVIARLGVVDNALVVATGNALEAALDARRGDNRLIDRDRWQAVSQEASPQLFVNLNTFTSTFLPGLGAPVSAQTSVLAARGQLLGDGLYQLKLTMTLALN